MSMFGLDKLVQLAKDVKMNKGVIKSLEKMWRMDTIKSGEYKGTDELGNKYYENNRYMIGRSRWVEYNPAIKWDYDGAQITPQWFGWIHYKTDLLPHEDPAKVYMYKCTSACNWLLPPEENVSGTRYAYTSYSTTRQHINVWDSRYTLRCHVRKNIGITTAIGQYKKNRDI